MHFVYRVCDGNAAAKEYRAQLPNRIHYPIYRVFLNVHRVYVEGHIPDNVRREGKPRIDVSDAN